MTTSTLYDMASDQAVYVFPASFIQEGLWFLDQLEPGSATYNIPLAIHLRGLIDVEALERSLNALVQRHEALRTTFRMMEEQPMQVVAPSLVVSLPVIDLRSFPEVEQEVEVLRLATEEGQQPFDLSQGPLVRATLLQLGAQQYQLLLSMHHIVSDDWSMDVFLRELASLYEAFSTGQPSPLPELPIQYADFVVWQREMLQGDILAEQLAYWQRQLAGIPTSLELPTDRPRLPVRTSQGLTYGLMLPKALAEGLKELSQREGVSLYMTLVAAWQTLLYRYTGQEDVVLGTVTAGRTQAETEALIGFFANTLVLRSDLSGNPSFTELLRRVREVVLEAQAHGELPFESLVKELHPTRTLGQNPLFQVMLSLDAPQPVLPGGWRLAQGEVETRTAKFDLTLYIGERPEGLSSRFEYSTDLFEEATIARLAGHWQTLLEGIVTHPDQRINELPLLTEQERHQLVVEWNATQAAYPQDRCLHELFEEQVERTPEAVAVVCEGEQLSYRELNRWANQLAHHLRERGVGPEVLVALLAERGIPFLISMLAVFKAGGAYLPLDPRHPDTRLRRVIEHSHCSLILATMAFTSTLTQALTDVPSERCPHLIYFEDLLQTSQSEENLPGGSTPRSLAYVIYTSGSTGLPKGVMIEQRGMLNHLYAKIAALDMTAMDNAAQTAPQCFDISVWQFLAALLVGGRVQIYPDAVASDPVQLLSQVEHQQVSILETVPSLLRAMLDTQETEAASRPKLEALRWLIPTGEALPVELCRRWLRSYPRIPLLNAYGPTECSDDVTHQAIYKAPEGTSSSIPIGRPIPNMRVYVLNGSLEPQPIGVSGEVYVGGIGVGRGYLGDEGRTVEAFVPDPFGVEAGARLYKTGDLARYRLDGTIEFLGRLDHQVKLRGFRIELGEIEAVLGRHPAVRQAVVVAREDVAGDKRLVAYVVLQKEQSATLDELKSQMTKQVPAYMVPSAFVLLETLPVTPNGKLDRHALPAPEASRSTAGETYVAPVLPVQQQLVQIWEDLLGVRPIGIKDDFFDLGGHSLLAIRLIDRIAQTCGKKLPLSTLFAGATIEHLATALMGEAKTDSRAPLVTVQTGGSRRAFFYLHGEWKGGAFYCLELARYMGPDQPFYLLEPYKFDGLAVPPTLEAIAAAHLKSLRAVQPEGPYMLGGYCNGGLMAYEMARQLRAEGQTVEPLVLMDPESPLPLTDWFTISSVSLAT